MPSATARGISELVAARTEELQRPWQAERKRRSTMTTLKYVKPEVLNLKNSTDFTEAWVRDRIQEDPSILGLGDVEVRDVERPQPKAGRLDLLLQDPESEPIRRYEVELQLGGTDESHIIRTIEYWDIERRRFSNYEHCAVIVAEDITTRFLNVISLFNGHIPIIAIQMRAMKIGDQILLQFTRVLDKLEVDDEEEAASGVIVDRNAWKQKVPETMLALVDDSLRLLHDLNPALLLTYKKHFIGLALNGVANNFIYFNPKRHFVRFSARVSNVPEWVKRLDEKGIDVWADGDRRVRLRLTPKEFESQREVVRELFKVSYQENGD